MQRAERVLVLGGTGFLGSHFVSSLGRRAVAHTTKTKHQESKIDFQQMIFQKNQVDELKAFLEKQNCGTIVNCVALADIEKCEYDQNLAYWMNCELPGLLSTICKSIDSKFVHISTDAVFDGSTSFRTEEDHPAPLSVYGKTKLSGEQLVLESNSQSLVARVNFFGLADNKTSLFNFFYDSLLSGRVVSGFTDVYFTPLYAFSLVDAVMELLQLKASGLLHVVGNERISKHEFGALIAETFGLPHANLKQSKLADTKGGVFRSLDLSLSNDKIKSLGISLPSVRDGLSVLKNTL